MGFTARSHEHELLDDPAIPLEVMEITLAEIDRINAKLGGFSASLSLLHRRLEARRDPVRLLDVGAGGGGTARHLLSWAAARSVPLEVTTLDVHAAACRVARKLRTSATPYDVVRGDAFALPFRNEAFHFVHCSLFLHHFPDEAVVHLLGEMRRVALQGVVVNDLERHPAAYHAIRVLTRLFGRAPLVRHDGPLSVRRGFQERDLERWRQASGLENLGFRRRWPFRWTAWWYADGGTPEGVS